jgi:hypothetical protein
LILEEKMQSGGFGSVLFKHKFVDVAPHPVFAGFERADDGMFGGVEMLGGVLIFRGIATANVAAR